MKKLVLIVSLIFVNVLIQAATWTDTEQFQKYKFARSVAIEADDAGNTSVAVMNYMQAFEIASEFCSKIEYSLNQMNSAAYCLIKVYKQTKDQTKDQTLIKEAFEILTEVQNIIEQQNITDEKLLSDVNSNINYCQENIK